MLVLKRKANQTVEIGDIVVRVLQTRQNCVRLAILAPDDVHIRRGELIEKPRGESGRARALGASNEAGSAGVKDPRPPVGTV